jgi:hypothetical protein
VAGAITSLSADLLNHLRIGYAAPQPPWTKIKLVSDVDRSFKQ